MVDEEEDTDLGTGVAQETRRVKVQAEGRCECAVIVS